MTSDHSRRLRAIGDALERAAVANLDQDRRPHRRPRWRSRRVAVLLAAGIVAVPAGAVAATELLSTSQVAASLPAGTLSLVGTHPSCTTVRSGVEYHCTLADPPSSSGGPPAGQWLGTVEPTVDATRHVNGGCRALAADGQTWECYLGETAVSQQIVSQGFLGQYSPTPGVG